MHISCFGSYSTCSRIHDPRLFRTFRSDLYLCHMMTDQLEFHLEIAAQTRRNMQGIMSGFDIEQLNTIPAGFRNNLAWNFAHVIVTQQLLCYSLSSLPMTVNNELVASYRKGTSPLGPVSQEMIDSWYELAQSTLEKTREDISSGIFQNFKEYPTSYKVTLHNLQEALAFNVAHEAMHLGTMMAMRKLL